MAPALDRDRDTRPGWRSSRLTNPDGPQQKTPWGGNCVAESVIRKVHGQGGQEPVKAKGGKRYTRSAPWRPRTVVRGYRKWRCSAPPALGVFKVSSQERAC